MNYIGQLQSYFKHPINRGHFFLTLYKYLSWQYQKRIIREPRIIDLDNNLKIKCYPDSPFGALIAYCTLPEYDELMFLKRFLKLGNSFFDIGANIGLFSILASSYVGENGKVYAFEPFAFVRKRLAENINLNKLQNIKIEPFCIAEKCGIVNFIIQGESTSRIGLKNEEGIKVHMTTLDKYIQQNNIQSIDLVKIDVEGAELFVLNGARKMLSKKMCKVIMLETNELSAVYGYTRTEIIKILKKYDYKAFAYDAELNAINEVVDFSSLPHNIWASYNFDSIFLT